MEEVFKYIGGDILVVRKRVMWLEDRMGILCGKVRFRVRVIFIVRYFLLEIKLMSLVGLNNFLLIKIK